MCRIYYFYGGIRYHSALASTKARRNRSSPIPSTQRHNSNDGGSGHLGTYLASSASLLSTKTVQYLQILNSFTSRALPVLELPCDHQNTTTQHQDKSTLMPTLVDTIPTMKVSNNPGSTKRYMRNAANQKGTAKTAAEIAETERVD